MYEEEFWDFVGPAFRPGLPREMHRVEPEHETNDRHPDCGDLDVNPLKSSWSAPTEVVHRLE